MIESNRIHFREIKFVFRETTDSESHYCYAKRSFLHFVCFVLDRLYGSVLSEWVPDLDQAVTAGSILFACHFLVQRRPFFFSWPFPAISEICSFRWHESTLKHRPGPHGSSGGRRSFSHRKWRNPFVIFEADIWNRETEQQTDCQGLLKLSVKKNIVALGDFISDPSPCLYHSLSRVVEVF